MAIIKLLSRCPDYAPILAFWSYREWYRGRNIDFDIIIKSYKNRTNERSMPISWVAIDEGIPVGMVSLKENDLWNRKDINPWLASLYVLHEFRNRGIGTMLINSVIDKGKELAINTLFLFTSIPDESNLKLFYSRRGWRFKEASIGNYGEPIRIFYYI